jgi:preprotein translocase subunit SecA
MDQVSAKFEGRNFRGMNPDEADRFVRDEAYHQAETQVQDAIDENLPGEEDEEGDWNWEALCSIAQRRWKLELRERDLKRIGKRDLSTYLLEEAKKSIEAVNLDEGSKFLADDFRVRSLAGWFQYKFGIEVKLEELERLDAPAAQKLLEQKAIDSYEQREAYYPVLAGLHRFTTGSSDRGNLQVDGGALIAWASERFETPIDLESIRGRDHNEIMSMLVAHSRNSQQKAEQAIAEVKQRVAKLFGDAPKGQTAQTASGGNGALDSLSSWLAESHRVTFGPAQIAELDRATLERKLLDLVEDRYRPEMRRMERQVLLDIIDTSWKDHLLVMDRLKSSIGLVGYAQLDAKVEYKREGMRLFDEMWKAIDEKATDLVFKVEDLGEDFISSTFVETSARHDEFQSTSEIARQQEQAIANSQTPSEDQKIEPIRNRAAKVGRNDPCPCGSGKKYKNCHMRSEMV